jgi:hypothetical protein
MIVHTTFQSVGWDCSSFGFLLLAAFSIVGVNVFVLIAGYFSAEPKKISLANLLFICLFWMIIRVAVDYSFGQTVTWRNLFFVTRSNWFIPAYLCLLFFAPVLNSFSVSASKRVLLGVTLSLFFFEIWFDLLPPHPAVPLGSQRGYSVLSFIALYLLARFIRLYGVPQWFRKRSFTIYLLCSLLLSTIALLFIEFGHPKTRILYAYSNPIIVLSAISFLITFEKMPLKENRVINHFAKSTLAVLLGHSAILFLYTGQFRFLITHYSGLKVVFLWGGVVLIVFFSSILLDQLRLLIWTPIENKLRQVIKRNELFSYGI